MMPQILPSVPESLYHKLRQTSVMLWGIFVVQVVGSWVKCKQRLSHRSFQQSSVLKCELMPGVRPTALAVQFPITRSEWFVQGLVMDLELDSANIKRELLACSSLWIRAMKQPGKNRSLCFWSRQIKEKVAGSDSCCFLVSRPSAWVQDLSENHEPGAGHQLAIFTASTNNREKSSLYLLWDPV